ncbi:MAG: hypothetical protein MAG794_00162 [Gammaproteobacteria bacterium]|nr:hypothetical protein [Gammaproteobacteria bacterium]
MRKVITLPENFIGKEDREKLESFGGHTIAHGRATRWHWTSNERGGDVFEIHRGGADEVLAYSLIRDRAHDVFRVYDSRSHEAASGDLEHVMAELDRLLATEHGESPA